MSDLQVVAQQSFQLAEGPRWVDGRLVFVDIFDGVLYEVVRGDVREVFRVDVPLGAVAPVAASAGEWIAAAGNGLVLVDGRGSVSQVAELEHLPGSRMNDAVCDPLGRFWAGSMCPNEAGAGALYRVDRDLTVTRVLDGVSIANGPAFSPDGATMFLSDSGVGTVTRFRVNPASAKLSQPEVIWRGSEAEGWPDGMTVDSTGNLWLALWGGSRVLRLDPTGRVLATVPTPARQPTAVCLTGDRRLVITSAWHGLADRSPADGRIWSTPVDVTGPPCAPFRRVGGARPR